MKKLGLTLIISFLTLFLVSCHKPIEEYEDAYGFSEGLAAVKIGGKYGYIDKDKNLIIKPGFDIANLFHKGKAWVKVEGKYGIIDKKGAFFVEPQFEDILNYDYPLYEFTIVQKDSKWGCMDNTTGNLVIDPIYDEIYPILNLDDAFIVKKNNKKGYINLQNEINIEPIYREIKPYPDENILVVSLKSKYGMLNLRGEAIVEPKYSYIGPVSFYDELIMVSKDNKIGFIDRNGNIIIEPRFEDAYSFREGLAPVKVNDKWGYIDRNGNFVIEPIYDEILYDKNYILLKSGCKWILSDLEGNILKNLPYEELDFTKTAEGLMPVKLNNKWGFVDEKYNLVI